MSLYEAKLESVPEEYFANMPMLPQMTQPDVIVRTENPLEQANMVVPPIIQPNKEEKANGETQGK